jgi:glycosyltransferase involved in cell wall biosynthesis
MKACFICSEYPPTLHGGIGTFTQLLGRGLKRSGHEVRVVGVYGPGTTGPRYQEDEGVKVWRLAEPARPGGWISARYALFRMVRDWSRRGEIDFVEAPDWAGWTAGWRHLGVPVIARLHGSASYFAAELGETVPPVLRWLERAAVRRADFRCSVSQYTARRTAALFDLAGIDAVLYNPVELPGRDRAGNRSTHRVVFSGTLTAKKGILTLLRAWPAVLAEVPGAELHLYGKQCPHQSGDRGNRHLTEALATTGPTVVRHGHVERLELLRALSEARVAVFPSYAEAFALAPLEAMACGCPTIYSRRGSGPEVAEDGREILLVDPDRPDDVAQAIVRVLTDDALAARLGEGGLDVIKRRFSMETLVRENEAFYRKCLNGRTPAEGQGA